MSSDWTEVSLGELAHIKHGYAFKGEHFSEDPRPEVLITPGSFAIGGGYQAKNLKYYAGPVPEDYVLRAGDLVVSMTDLSKAGDTLGYAAMVPSDLGYRLLHNQRVGLVVMRHPEQVHTPFIHWLMRSGPYRHEVLASASGSTVRHTSPARIAAFRFKLPPLAEQRHIAAVLGALEARIELNRASSRTLEELAQVLYKSWFIDFDGHDDLVDSEVGRIPRGWKVGTLPDLVELNPRVSLAKGTMATHVEMKALPTDSSTIAFTDRQPFMGGGSKFQQHDTLLARITPCLEKGKTAFVDVLHAGEAAFGSTEFIVMRGRENVPPAWVYALARSPALRSHAIANMTGSSGRQRVPVDCFEHFAVAVPPTSAWTRFGQVARPLFERIRANASESRTLCELRDTLLPKLVFGELRVPEAVIAADG